MGAWTRRPRPTPVNIAPIWGPHAQLLHRRPAHQAGKAPLQCGLPSDEVIRYCGALTGILDPVLPNAFHFYVLFLTWTIHFVNILNLGKN